MPGEEWRKGRTGDGEKWRRGEGRTERKAEQGEERGESAEVTYHRDDGVVHVVTHLRR